MKRWIGWVLAAAVILGAAVVAVQETSATPDPALAGADEPRERLLLGVDRVTCGSCEGRIRAALGARPGVRGVAVDLAQNTVTVEYAVGSDDPKALADVITRSGYPARFLAAGTGAAPVQPAAARPGGGCGGTCCAGG